MIATIRSPQREFEAIVGGALLHTVGKAAQSLALRKSGLIANSVMLKTCSYEFFYHEREAESIDGKGVDKKDQPTLIFFHGISQKSEDFAHFISQLRIPPNVRILVPEQMAHGRDIRRARLDAQNYVQPTHYSMLESTCEFLDAVQCGSNTHAFGISLGGATCYYVANARPDIIKRSVLVSPAIVPCVDKDLVKGIEEGSRNFFCFESREDVKLLMRDLSTGREDTSRRKRDPVPKFFHETIYRTAQTVAPSGHYKAMLTSLLTNVGLTQSDEVGLTPETDKFQTEEDEVNPFSATLDIDLNAQRLVIWPEKDQIINFEQGKAFFEVTEKGGKFSSKSSHTEFESVPDCGHVFDADGKSIMDIIRSRVREYLLDFEQAETVTKLHPWVV